MSDTGILQSMELVLSCTSNPKAHMNTGQMEPPLNKWFHTNGAGDVYIKWECNFCNQIHIIPVNGGQG